MEQDGVQKTHYANGQVESETTYVNGLPNGVTRRWHPNGVLATELPVKEGMVEGVAKQWNEKGELLGSYEMRDGNGVQKFWHANGQLQSEVPMQAGKITGRQRVWGDDGTLLVEIFWIHNQKVSQKKYLQACEKNPSLPRYVESDVKPAPPPVEHANRSPQDAELHEKIVAGFRSKPNQSEAREWLRNNPEAQIGENTHDGSVEIIEAGYRAGATKIVAADIQKETAGGETTDHLLVDLPSDGKQRKRVFKWSSALARQSGFDADMDWGQKEVYIFFD